jgi:uncharacterized membrane protein HdeD (DUF308 family)
MEKAETKSPKWVRTVQIGLGIIAIFLSIYVLAFPGATFFTIVYILAVILFLVAIERIITGFFTHGSRGSKWGSVGLGILVLIISVIVMSFPVATGVFLLVILAIALLFDGIARVVHGLGSKSSGMASRTFSIVAGAIAIALSIMIMASPFFGAVLIGLLLSIALLIVGIQILVAGITGKRAAVMGR